MARKPRKQNRPMSANEVIENAQYNFELAVQGLQDILSVENARIYRGLSNAAVYGKSAIDVLGKMRMVDRGAFDTWYEPREDAMLSDPLMEWFFGLRHQVLKERPPDIVQETLPTDLLRLFEEAGEVGLGLLTGEEIPLEVREAYNIRVTVPSAPTAHLGAAIPASMPIADLVRLALRYIEVLIAAASREFSTVQPPERR